MCSVAQALPDGAVVPTESAHLTSAYKQDCLYAPPKLIAQLDIRDRCPTQPLQIPKQQQGVPDTRFGGLASSVAGVKPV